MENNDYDVLELLKEIDDNNHQLEMFRKHINEQLDIISSRMQTEVVEPTKKLDSFNLFYSCSETRYIEEMQDRMLDIKKNIKAMDDYVTNMSRSVQRYNHSYQRKLKQEANNNQ